MSLMIDWRLSVSLVADRFLMALSVSLQAGRFSVALGSDLCLEQRDIDPDAFLYDNGVASPLLIVFLYVVCPSSVLFTHQGWHDFDF